MGEHTIVTFGNQCASIKRLNPSLICLTVFNLAYFFLFSPFKAKYCEIQQQLIRKTNPAQQIGTACVHICTLLAIGQRLLNFTNSEKYDFHNWSIRTVVFLWAIYIITTMSIFWFKQQAVVNFLNEFHNLCCYLTSNGLIFIRKAEVISAATFFPVCMLLFVGLQVYLIIDSLHFDISFDADSRNDSVAFGQGDSFKAVFTTVMEIAFTSAIAMTMLGHGLVISLTISTLIVVRSFVGHVQKLEKDVDSMVKVLDGLDRFSIFFETTTQVFGPVICTGWLAYIPNFALEIISAFSGDTPNKVRVISNVVLFFCPLFLAASVHSQIKSIQRWIQHSLSNARKTLFCYIGLHLRVNLLMQQINANEFSFSGSLFVITYGFIGSTCGLILTYAIVVRGEK